MKGAARPIRRQRFTVLVRSERVNGQPRQRIVVYPSTIADLIYDGNRVWFWRAVTPRLDWVGRDAAEQARIVAQLAVVVPQPIDTEWT